MKKFFITLLILILLAGTAFFFGWVQFTVPPGHYGVINSKTHGIDPQLVRSGEFRWLWYKLIPTNVNIAVFNLKQTKLSIFHSSSLPSGDTYAAFLGIMNADFSWNIQGDIAFNIYPERLITLTGQQNLNNQEDLDQYLQTVAGEIELIILRIISSASTDSERLEYIMSGNIDPEMQKEITDRFPEITDLSFVIHTAKFPDFILYRQIRLLYEEFLATQREFISSSFARMAETHIEAQLRFDELERYGDLLSRFPILLEFMEMENRNQ